MRAVSACVLLAALAAGCNEKGANAKSGDDPAGGATTALLGIDIDKWSCDLLATPAVMSELLGGPTRTVESSMGTAPGTHKPCSFVFDGPPPQAWSFDVDCRPGALTTAHHLFDEYATNNAEQIAAFDAATGGKELKDDAGVVQHAVEAAREVDVGKKGLDHHGQAILFIDDDAPCYVRVAGPDADHRLALARLLAQKLTAANAPMKPYAAPK